jgi:hypothetical protein
MKLLLEGLGLLTPQAQAKAATAQDRRRKWKMFFLCRHSNVDIAIMQQYFRWQNIYIYYRRREHQAPEIVTAQSPSYQSS